MRKKIKETKDLKNIVILRSLSEVEGAEGSLLRFFGLKSRPQDDKMMILILTAMFFLLSGIAQADSTRAPTIGIDSTQKLDKLTNTAGNVSVNTTKIQTHNPSASEGSLINGTAAPSNLSVVPQNASINPWGINNASVDTKLSRRENDDYKGASSYQNPMGAYYNNGRRVNDPDVINPKYRIVDDKGNPVSRSTEIPATVYVGDPTQSRTPVGKGIDGKAYYQQFKGSAIAPNQPLYNGQGQVAYEAAQQKDGFIEENIGKTKSITLFNGERFEVTHAITGQSDARANGFSTKQGWFIPFAYVDKSYTNPEGTEGETNFLYNRYR